MIKKITADELQELVIDKKNPVVLDFGAEYCGPCKKLAPIIADLAGELAGQVDFYEVDAGAEPGIAQQYGVMSLPTLLMFKDGDVKERMVGLAAKAKILKKINGLL